MIAIAEETLGFRRSGLSPDLRLLIPTFSLLNAPAHFAVNLHSYWTLRHSNLSTAILLFWLQIANSSSAYFTQVCFLTLHNFRFEILKFRYESYYGGESVENAPLPPRHFLKLRHLLLHRNIFKLRYNILPSKL